MIKSFIGAVAGVVFLGTACDMLIPEGNLKKYYKLAIGFVVMCVLTKPITKFIDFPMFEFTPVEEMSEEEILAQSNAYILKMHEENIRKGIMDMCGNVKEVFVQLYSDGRVKSVMLKGKHITAAEAEKIKNETGCEDITVIDDEY